MSLRVKKKAARRSRSRMRRVVERDDVFSDEDLVSEDDANAEAKNDDDNAEANNDGSNEVDVKEDVEKGGIDDGFIPPNSDIERNKLRIQELNDKAPEQPRELEGAELIVKMKKVFCEE